MKFSTGEEERSQRDDQLIPMINVVFLLLIFFMIAGTIKEPAPANLTAPTSNQNQTLPSSSTLYVDKEGGFYFIGESVSAAELVEKLASGGWNGDSIQPPLSVMFDKHMSMKTFAEVMSFLQATDVKNIDIITEATQLGPN